MSCRGSDEIYELKIWWANDSDLETDSWMSLRQPYVEPSWMLSIRPLIS